MSKTTLNPAQLAAVHHLAGPCLVIAGAGSGKTSVITQKIAKLMSEGYRPKNIAAITFTNKASQEMRERARHLVGNKAGSELVVSTFHSLGVRILREDGRHLGLKEQFSILDSDDVLSVLRDAGGTTDAATAKSWQWTISLWKNQNLSAQQALAYAKDDMERAAAVVMQRYQERLTAYQAVDFDDLILHAAEAAADQRGSARQVAGDAPVRAGRRVPGHQRQPVRAAEAAGGRARDVHRGGRRRPVDLRLARRDHREPQEAADGLPAAQGHSAGAELPLHQRASCARPTTSSAAIPSSSRRRCGASSARATPSR